MPPTPTPMAKWANISPCGRYRYSLSRRWAESGPVLLFVMLNPSTADAMVDDPTIRRCIGFGRSHAFGAIEVVNLYAFRATDPKALRLTPDPVGPENDAHIQIRAANADRVCVAWGTGVSDDQRADWVMRLLRAVSPGPFCLGITKSGHPRHPLYVPAAQILMPYDLQGISDAVQ